LKDVYKITLEIEQLPEGPYLGTSPELPGLVVQGESVQEILSLAPDVAHDLIAVMVETNQPLPPGIETVTAPGRVPVLVPA
jgi:predicted RNase H-like HicB family nuclease